MPAQLYLFKPAAGSTALNSLELCAGAGGQALGLEQAGFEHAGLVEIDPHCCQTLRLNRPQWAVHQADLNHFDGLPYRGKIDLLAGGVPCPPFSKAGKQLGADDDRNLFPAAIRLVAEIQPRAVLFENVRGLLDAVFQDYRDYIAKSLAELGYWTSWRLVNASDYGVPQLRPRVMFVALKRGLEEHFRWPDIQQGPAPTVGDTLQDLMAAKGWKGCSPLGAAGQRNCPDAGGRLKKARRPRPWPHARARCLGALGGGWQDAGRRVAGARFRRQSQAYGAHVRAGAGLP